jgi:hypothetical protein
MTLTGWDAILASALTVPGAADPRGALSADGQEFVWARWNAPTWSTHQAMQRLGIALLPFPEARTSTIGGFATRDGIALNARVRLKVRTAAHELAHVLLGHVHGTGDDARRPIEEFEADAVALLVCHALQLGEVELADCRHYIQQFAARPCGGPLPTSWTAIKTCARRILDAGHGRFWVAPEPAPLQVQSAAAFAKRIKLGAR